MIPKQNVSKDSFVRPSVPGVLQFSISFSVSQYQGIVAGKNSIDIIDNRFLEDV